MKKGFCLILFCLLMLAVSAAEFDPAACPDLSVKLFPGNNNWAVLLVTVSGYAHSGLGFDYAKCRIAGKLSKNT